MLEGVKRGDVCIEIVGHSDRPYLSMCLFSCCSKPPIVLISSTNIHTITVATILITSAICLCPKAKASAFIRIARFCFSENNEVLKGTALSRQKTKATRIWDIIQAVLFSLSLFLSKVNVNFCSQLIVFLHCAD